MEGQWVGSPDDEPGVAVTVDLERRGTRFSGSAFLFEATHLPNTFLRIETADLALNQRLERVPLEPVHPSGIAIPRPKISELFPGIEFAEWADIELRADGPTMRVAWVTSLGRSGSAELSRSVADTPSSIAAQAEIATWEEFKAFAVRLDPREFIFRGQCGRHRLRTAFHRTWRKDLSRFIREDIPSLHQTLSARTRHVFNLDDPLQNGAFWNLAQHHGYPTPLLDWTYSPFVAAFFALNPPLHSPNTDPISRIYVFDKTAWIREWRQLQVLVGVRPHFSVLEALAIENERAIPQQAVSTVTNIDDIETYIAKSETTAGRAYLRAIDLPRTCRDTALAELTSMGIGPGSLFPGLDGACQELRARFFGW